MRTPGLEFILNGHRFDVFGCDWDLCAVAALENVLSLEEKEKVIGAKWAFWFTGGFLSGIPAHGVVCGFGM